MKLALFTVVATLALATAYDFRDEVYNQIIRQDLDELESYASDTITNYRLKREETKPEPSTTVKSVEPPKPSEPKPIESTVHNKPSEDKKPAEDKAGDKDKDKCKDKKKRFRMCCGEEIVDGIMEKDKELKRECYKEVTGMNKEDKPFGGYDPFNCEKVNKTKKEWTCVMQCVAQKKNLVDADGNIKEKECLEFFKTQFAKEEWLFKLVEKAYPKCYEKSKNMTSFVKNKEDPLSCSPAAMKMHHCMWREIQLTCPDEKITDSKTCNKIREKIKKHEDIGFRHVHHVHDDD